jgi:flagellar basal body-associated protein FliL
VTFPSRCEGNERGTEPMSILWIILIVVLVLALLGFFSRGVW